MSKYIKYLTAFFIPVFIFFCAACIAGYFPAGQSIFNIFDSIAQYPGFFIALKNFSLFSFSGGLGFNMLATATYYLMSPLNLLILFFNNLNFYIFFTIIIYIKIGLSSLFMCIFLTNENDKKKIWTVLFSTAYALCGFASCYYYNTMWMDGVYLLPLVLLGIKKLIFENKKVLYLLSLSLAIIFNFYIGYMICIFSAIYFIYQILINNKIYLKQIKPFLITSCLAALIACIVLVPAFFGLSQGKIVGFNNEYTNYFELNANIKYFFYMLTPGSYQFNGQSFGPAQIYCSLFVVVLVLLFFFNPKFTKKEKIVIGCIIFFYFISFLWTGLDFAWQFFQRPVWWQSRYSFTFSAFLIIIAYKSISHLDSLKLTTKQKIITAVSLILLISISYIFNHLETAFYKNMNIAFIVISLFLIVDYFLFLDKPQLKFMIIIFLCIELSINTFSNLKKNNMSTNVDTTFKFKEIRAQAVNNIQEYDDGFYRLEFVTKDSSNDGLLYNYNGINYFNSVRNQKIVNFMENYTNIMISGHCGIIMDYFNPYLLSLFNIKYLLDGNIDYFEKVIDNSGFSSFANPYPLSIGFMVNEKIKDTKLSLDEFGINLNKIFSAMINEEISTYRTISGEFIADKNYFLIRKDTETTGIFLNEEFVVLNSTFNIIKKGDKITTEKEVKLFEVTTYEEVMEQLSTNLLVTSESNHVLKGNINVNENNQMLFLSIPYDKGLKITVDNQIVEPIILLETFIGIKLESGEHEIIIDYIPKGLKTGSVLSATGLLLSIIYLSKKRNKID